MTKATARILDPKLRRLTKTINDYYDVADMDKLEELVIVISWPHIKLSRRKKNFRTHKKTIFALKPLFKRFVLAQNKLAKKNGHKNRIDFINQSNGISKEKFELFLETTDQIIKTLNQKFPEPPPEWAEWYWSKYNTPDAPCLATKKKYVVPEDIVKMIKKKTPKVAALLPKIEIQKLKNVYSSARYDKKKKKVIISTPLRKTSICGALTFIHEIAHAVVMLNYMEKGIDTSDKSKYWREKKAHEVESQLVKALFSKKIYDAWLASFLDQVSSTLFEYEIYNHPERNFARAFARANNRCYLKAHQRENPLYVLHTYLINRSGYSAITSVAITELLLEGKI